MDGNRYQELAAVTINPFLSSKLQEQHALFGMVSEIGEIHGLYQKILQGHEFDYEHVKKELGDLTWFISEFCTSQGWNLNDIFEMNIEKLKKRYPKGFTSEQSIHRDEGDI